MMRRASGPRRLGLLTTRSVRFHLPLVETYVLEAWAALGDRTRRVIFTRLANQPSPVGELAATLPVSRPAVSQHLKVLKDAGLVTAQRQGNRHIYKVDPKGLQALRTELNTFWDDTLTAYKAAVERSEDGVT